MRAGENDDVEGGAQGREDEHDTVGPRPVGIDAKTPAPERHGGDHSAAPADRAAWRRAHGVGKSCVSVMTPACVTTSNLLDGLPRPMGVAVSSRSPTETL